MNGQRITKHANVQRSPEKVLYVSYDTQGKFNVSLLSLVTVSAVYSF